jgi:hypothetical protein
LTNPKIGAKTNPIYVQKGDRMNTLAVTEIKRRGIGIADAMLANGPVYITKNNRPHYVLLRQEDDAVMRTQPAIPPNKPFKFPDFAAIRKEIWGDRVFSKAETDEMDRWEKEWEGG